jgi:hypothetical protein
VDVPGIACTSSAKERRLASGSSVSWTPFAGVAETARLTAVIEPEQAAQSYVPLGRSACRSSGATIPR